MFGFWGEPTVGWPRQCNPPAITAARTERIAMSGNSRIVKGIGLFFLVLGVLAIATAAIMFFGAPAADLAFWQAKGAHGVKPVM